MHPFYTSTLTTFLKISQCACVLAQFLAASYTTDHSCFSPFLWMCHSVISFLFSACSLPYFEHLTVLLCSIPLLSSLCSFPSFAKQGLQLTLFSLYVFKFGPTRKVTKRQLCSQMNSEHAPMWVWHKTIAVHQDHHQYHFQCKHQRHDRSIIMCSIALWVTSSRMHEHSQGHARQSFHVIGARWLIEGSGGGGVQRETERSHCLQTGEDLLDVRAVWWW